MVEFTLVVPILVLLLLGIIQFGILFNDYVEVTNAARDGARTGAVSRESATGVADAVASARRSVSFIDRSRMVVVVGPSQPWTAGQDLDVQVRYPASISLLGVVVWSGELKAESIVRME